MTMDKANIIKVVNFWEENADSDAFGYMMSGAATIAAALNAMNDNDCLEQFWKYLEFVESEQGEYAIYNDIIANLSLS